MIRAPNPRDRFLGLVTNRVTGAAGEIGGSESVTDTVTTVLNDPPSSSLPSESW
jgi:hypothetical protein